MSFFRLQQTSASNDAFAHPPVKRFSRMHHYPIEPHHDVDEETRMDFIGQFFRFSSDGTSDVFEFLLLGIPTVALWVIHWTRPTQD